MKPKVSVGIPVYNGAKFIGAAIESVLNQTFSDFELIVSDDESTDQTEDVVLSFKDSRIRFVRNNKKTKAPGNFNNCLENSNGKYVCVFHADDIMFPTNLEKKVEILDKHLNVGMVHSNFVQTDHNGNSIRGNWAADYWSHENTKDAIFDGSKHFEELVSGGDFVCASAVVARHQCFENVGGFDLSLLHACDLEMWLRLSLFYDVGYLGEPLVKYRWHEGQDTHNFAGKLKALDEYYRAKIYNFKKYPKRIANLSQLKHKVENYMAKQILILAHELDDKKQYPELRDCISYVFKISPRFFLDYKQLRLLVKSVLSDDIINNLQKVKSKFDLRGISK